MIDPTLVRQEVETGSLIFPFGEDLQFPFSETFPQETGYYLVYLKKLLSRPAFQAFRTWLLDESHAFQTEPFQAEPFRAEH